MGLGFKKEDIVKYSRINIVCMIVSLLTFVVFLILGFTLDSETLPALGKGVRTCLSIVVVVVTVFLFVSVLLNRRACESPDRMLRLAFFLAVAVLLNAALSCLSSLSPKLTHTQTLSLFTGIEIVGIAILVIELILNFMIVSKV